MTVLSDAGTKFERTVVMSNSSGSPTAVAGNSPNSEEPSEGTRTVPKPSTITVNTKTPTGASFPPPKTDKPRPHVCGTCQRSFARLEHLKRHERSHTKEKPFECPECTRCFARRDLLLRHQQKLHQTTTPSRPRNRRESQAGNTANASRARKNSVAVQPSAAAAAAAAAAQASMRPRANTISHIDPTTVQMMNSANANVARGIPPVHNHNRHPSLAGLPINMDHAFAGMSSAMSHRGLAHGLPKLETHGINNLDFSGGLRTAPPLAVFNTEFDFEGIMFGGPGSTINPNALHTSHFNESPHSIAMDPLSPFMHGLPDMSARPLDDTFPDWLSGFEQQMSFNAAPTDNTVDGSSPSAISTTSQSNISDVMLDGSNHPCTTAGSSSIWHPSLMGPPQTANPFSLDLGHSVFPDLMNGAPVSPQPHTNKNLGEGGYFSTPPPSLSSLSPSVISGLNTQNLSQTLNFGAGPETPSSMNGSSQGTLPISTITDSTRNTILGALTTSQTGGRRFSFAAPSSRPQFQSPSSLNGTGFSPDISNLPSTADLQRYVSAYLRYFHPHLPFLHLPTLSFDIPTVTAANRGNGFGGSGYLILSMAAIGALYENEEQPSRDLFVMAKKMIQLYLDERRKASVRKAGFRRNSMSEHNSQQQETVDAPVWLVQAMLLNVVYGHNCGDKRSGEIASTHAAALVSLAQGAELLKPSRINPSDDVKMTQGDSIWGNGHSEAEEQAEWLRWKTNEERKRTLYVIFILSSLLVSAYNHAPAITNSEVLLDLPCDENFFAAENPQAFRAMGGVAAANHNRMTFHEALGELLSANEKQQKAAAMNAHPGFGIPVGLEEMSASDLRPSTFGCLILINALHNYIWETRQRHHNKIWTNEETEKMHRHIEPALKAWQTAWSSNPRHSVERPNPFGEGPISADAIPLLDLAYIRLFINFSRSKEKFWQRNWDGVAEELSRGNEIVQHAEHSPSSNGESGSSDPSDMSGSSSVFVDSPLTQSSSPEFASAKFPPGPGTVDPALGHQSFSTPVQTPAQLASGRATSRREKHLRKAAFYAADSLSMSDKLGVSFGADFTARELPMQSALCAFDCAQVLAEWVAALQDRVGRYLGILGRDDVDPTQVPAIMLLEEEDVKLLGKIQEVLASADLKRNMELATNNGLGLGSGLLAMHMDEHMGYAAKILRVTGYMLDKGAIWPVTRLMVSCLETHANHMRARAEESVIGLE